MVSLKTSKHRCQCYSEDYNSLLFGLRREAPSTDRVLQERLLNVLSRAAAQKSRNPQRLWAETVKPDWWSDVTDLPWKNPREHPKDKKGTLKEKIAIIERELRKRGLMSKELEAEINMQRDSKKVDLELKSDFEAVIAKASGLHYLLEKSCAKITRTHIVSEKVGAYAMETRKCLQKCLSNLDKMCSKVEEQNRRNSSLWTTMGVSKQQLLDTSLEVVLDSGHSLPPSYSPLSPSSTFIVLSPPPPGSEINESSAVDEADYTLSPSNMGLSEEFLFPSALSPSFTRQKIYITPSVSSDIIASRRRQSADELEEIDQDQLRWKSRRTESSSWTSMRETNNDDFPSPIQRVPFSPGGHGLSQKNFQLRRSPDAVKDKYSNEELRGSTSAPAFRGRSKSATTTSRELWNRERPQDIQQDSGLRTTSDNDNSFHDKLPMSVSVTERGLTNEPGPSTAESSCYPFSHRTLASEVTMDCADVSDELEDVEYIIEESDRPTITMYDAVDTADMDELAKITREVSVEDLSATVTEEFMYDLPAPRITTLSNTEKQVHYQSTRTSASATATSPRPGTDHDSLSIAIGSLSGYFEYHN